MSDIDDTRLQRASDLPGYSPAHWERRGEFETYHFVARGSAVQLSPTGEPIDQGEWRTHTLRCNDGTPPYMAVMVTLGSPWLEQIGETMAKLVGNGAAVMTAASARNLAAALMEAADRSDGSSGGKDGGA